MLCIPTPLSLFNTSGMSNDDLLAELGRAEGGRCYASIVELLREATDRGLLTD